MDSLCLNTIYLYIILKPVVGVLAASVGLNTIYLYIIKLEDRLSAADHCLNTIYLYIILRLRFRGLYLEICLNTIYLYIILKRWKDGTRYQRFEYHISLHHSQTSVLDELIDVV